MVGAHETTKANAWDVFSSDAALAVLDCLSIGFVLVDAAARIVAVTAAAATALRAEDGLFDDDGFLCAESSADTHALRRQVQAAVEKGAFGALLVRRSREVKPHAVGVRPCRSGGQTLALVVIQDTGQKSQAHVERVRSTFRLAPAEADIVVQLALGADLTEIAAARRVKINTIRTQMATAMVKVGVRRQAELVAAVAGLNVLA